MSGSDKLPDSKVLAILKKYAEEQQKQEVVVERVEEYKKALNRILKSKDGKFVFDHILKYCQIYAVSKHSDVVRMAEDRGKRNVWLEMIHQFLDPTNRQDF